MNESNLVSIVANGKSFDVCDGLPLPEFLESINLSIKNVVVERNRIALSPGDANKTLIENGDTLEIIRIVAGG